MAISVERGKQARARMGLSQSTFYEHLSKGLIPPGVSLGGRIVAWPSDELDQIIQARIRGASDETIRGIVRDLVAARGRGVVRRGS